jgi:hypothetical protein
MATLISSVLANARVDLLESSASFWTDAELLQHFKEGVADLWRSIILLDEAHFQTTDITNVSLAANSETLTGVPTDCFKVVLIEPRDLSSTSSSALVMFWPRKGNSAAARNARQLSAQDPTGGLDIYYEVEGKGSPVAAPVIRVTPQVSSAVNLRFVYIANPAQGALTASDNNPIPGESDKALRAWVVAHARAKEREDRSPDPNFLAIYKTEKDSILTTLEPRQDQEPIVVEDFFGGYL